MSEFNFTQLINTHCFIEFVIIKENLRVPQKGTLQGAGIANHPVKLIERMNATRI